MGCEKKMHNYQLHYSIQMCLHFLRSFTTKKVKEKICESQVFPKVVDLRKKNGAVTTSLQNSS